LLGFTTSAATAKWYHLPAILALADGWNPYKFPQLGEWNAGFEREIGNVPSAAIYVQHYAKGVWIVAAAAYRATGLLEVAKVVNLLYLLAAYVFAAGFLRRLGLSRLWVHGLSLATAANPVILYQTPSFFVDGQVAALFTLLVLLSLEYFRAQRLQVLVLLAACVVLLANVKFTGVVYAVALGGGFVLLHWLQGARQIVGRYAAIGAFSAVVAIALVGYQPYVTNFRLHGNPFYPVLDRDQAADTAMAGQFEHWAPPAFMAMGRLEKLTRSLLAESGDAESMPRWKVPFSVAKRELYIFFNTEPRYGGFGPLFGSVLWVTLLVFMVAARAIERRVRVVGAVVALLMALTALLNPEAWVGPAFASGVAGATDSADGDRGECIGMVEARRRGAGARPAWRFGARGGAELGPCSGKESRVQGTDDGIASARCVRSAGGHHALQFPNGYRISPALDVHSLSAGAEGCVRGAVPVFLSHIGSGRGLSRKQALTGIYLRTISAQFARGVP